MWRKKFFSYKAVFNKEILRNNSRCSSSINSYFHQPGSEPLRYVTVGDTILESVNLWPGRVAVCSVHQNQSLTFSQLWSKAEALACGLISAGLKPGDRLGVWAHNCTEWIVTLAAAVRIGIIPVALNPIYEIPELSYCIKKVGMKGLVIGETIKGRLYSTTINRMIPELKKCKPGDISSDAFPELKIVISCGDEILPCTAVYGTPTMFVDLISEARSQASSPTSLKVVLTAGAPCSPKLFQDIKEYLKPQTIKSLFGMTETTAAIFQSLPDETMEQVTETVGCVQEHIEVKVINSNDTIVPFGSPGELLVRGYNTMMCYWDEPEKTRETIGPDGWLRTGDKFVLQEDGYGRIVGRLKDIVVRGGENIAPKEIEDVLDTHPEIIESQVIGVSDDRLGEDLCAVIRLRNKHNLTVEDVKKHCAGKISKFKIPRLLRIVDSYPKTASGKIQKFKLKEMIESGEL